jgi:uncharacterized membrane protein
MDKARIEAFSDGVFGFAITLLVLGVQVPMLKTANDAELRIALLQELSQLVPYVTSFATIGIIWLNHHAMFHSVERGCKSFCVNGLFDSDKQSERRSDGIGREVDR